MTTTTKTRGKRDNPYSVDGIAVTIHRSAAGTAWRWRTELTILSSLTAAYLWLWVQLQAALFAALVMAGFFGLVFGLPWSRRFTLARMWCTLTRHRFQRLCWESRLHTRAGRLPAVLWVRPTRVGERLFVWCRAGVAAEDFEQHTGELRAACYAREARVTRNTRWSHIVTIDIIRRDTLAAKNTVGTPLTRLTAIYAGQLTPAIPAPALPQDDHPGWPDIPGPVNPAG